MPRKSGNISLSSYDDIFGTDQSRVEESQERVREISLSELHPFEGHPFQVKDDEDMIFFNCSLYIFISSLKSSFVRPIKFNTLMIYPNIYL